MKIGVISGYWSTNIGNSFFQLGAFWLFQKIFPEAEIFLVPDVHGYVYPKNGSPSRSLNLLGALDLDLVVVLGPFLTAGAHQLLAPELAELRAKGAKVVGLSVGLMDYGLSSSEIAKFVRESGFDLLMTRDEETFNILDKASLDVPVVNGIDAAFFISDAVKVPSSMIGDGRSVVSLAFDQVSEPKVSRYPFPKGNEIKLESSSFFIGAPYFEHESKLTNFFKRIMKSYFSSQDAVHPDIHFVRADHRYNPYIQRKIFSMQHTFAADIPHGYLTLYANSDAVLSNRVHACAAALSYGVPAMLFSKNRRGGLLERVGAKNIRSELIDPTSLDLATKKLHMMELIRKHIKGLI